MEGRFSIGVLITFLITLWMQAKALPRIPDEEEEIATGQGRIYRGRSLEIPNHMKNMSTVTWTYSSNLDVIAGTTQGHLLVNRATPQTAGRRESDSDREYLQGLVEATALAKHDQVANIAFLKTHKTASTTLAAILYRYAARHDLELARFKNLQVNGLQSAAIQTQETGELVDIMHYHISLNGQYRGTWKEAAGYYREIMRYPNRINYVTLLREPRSHLLSYYYYYIQPKNQLSIEEFLMNRTDAEDRDHRRLQNPLSAEFGVRAAEDLASLITDALPDFKLIILTERFDDGLLVLRRILQWDMIDVTYCELNETKEGQKRWDGIPFVNRPHFDSLPKEVQDKIDDLTDLDRVLYAAGKIEFEKQLAQYSGFMDEDREHFQELQGTILQYLDSNSSSMANTMYRSKNDVYKGTPKNHPF